MATKKFGELLKECRKRRDVTLGQLAEKMDVAPSYLSDIEHGRRNPLKKEAIEQLVRILDLNKADQDALIDAAQAVRGQFDIPADPQNAAAYTFGAALAREWTSMNSGDYEKLMTVLEQIRQSKKG